MLVNTIKMFSQEHSSLHFDTFAQYFVNILSHDIYLTLRLVSCFFHTLLVKINSIEGDLLALVTRASAMTDNIPEVMKVRGAFPCDGGR